jgi:hypothetical protein
MMVDTLTKFHSEVAATRRDMMKTQDNDQDWAEWATDLTQGAPITGGAGQEIVAAIITAGMLPPLPAPKLRRVAEERITREELEPALDVVSNALHLYINVLQTLRYTEAPLSEARGRPTATQ